MTTLHPRACWWLDTCIEPLKAPTTTLSISGGLGKSIQQLMLTHETDPIRRGGGQVCCCVEVDDWEVSGGVGVGGGVGGGG